MRRIILFAFLLLFLFSSWGWCNDGYCSGSQGYICSSVLGAACSGGCGIHVCSDPNSSFPCFNESFYIGRTYTNVDQNGQKSFCIVIDARQRDMYCSNIVVSVQCCSDQCAQQQRLCELKGWNFNSQTCECEEPCDQSLCDNYHSQCDRMQGDFTGSVRRINGQCCCSANCNICSKSSLNKAYEQKKQQCCEQDLAPPTDVRRCAQLPESGCGMSVPVLSGQEGNEWACRDPNLSDEALDSFVNECYGSSSSVSSSSGGTSSGGDSSGGDSSGNDSSNSNNPYPEGCDECPWLDSILDTLVAQKGIISDIYNCLYLPGLCSMEGNQISIDTTIMKYIRPLMDSSLKFDSSQLQVLKRLDSTMLKLLALDSGRSSGSDTNVKRAIDGGFSILDSTTDALNDSTRKWLRRIADSLGVGTDSLMAHIDSIVSRLPDSILDSILKYQKYASDNFDSAFWGSGNGFNKIDNLADSAIKYFEEGFHYDSVYSALFRDSLGEIHEAITDIGVNIGYNLGYGDTASKNLRDDLEGIRQAIEGLQFGEGSGVISAFDSAINANGGGRVDTNGIYLPIYGGDSIADSIGRDVGYGGINVGRDTSAMDSVERLGVEESDSTICVGSECVNFDSDRKISDSLNRYITQQGDSIRMGNQAFYRDSVDKMFQDVKDTLTKWNPFGMFDSTLMKTLGAKVPNTNTCPEHCTKFAIPVPFSFGPLNLELDWNLCHPWLVLGSKDVMSFLRFIIRVIVAVTCIGMVMQAAANTKIK